VGTDAQMAKLASQACHGVKVGSRCPLGLGGRRERSWRIAEARGGGRAGARTGRCCVWSQLLDQLWAGMGLLAMGEDRPTRVRCKSVVWRLRGEVDALAKGVGGLGLLERVVGREWWLAVLRVRVVVAVEHGLGHRVPSAAAVAVAAVVEMEREGVMRDPRDRCHSAGAKGGKLCIDL
jgi:hypothetical protein